MSQHSNDAFENPRKPPARPHLVSGPSASDPDSSSRPLRPHSTSVEVRLFEHQIQSCLLLTAFFSYKGFSRGKGKQRLGQVGDRKPGQQ